MAVGLAAVAVAGVASPAPAAPPSRGDAAPHLVLLRNGGDTPARAQRHTARVGGQVLRVFERVVAGYVAQLTPDQSRRLAADPDVVAVEPDHPVALAGQELPTGLDRVSNPHSSGNTALELGIDGRDDLRVDSDLAVLDTGVDGAHPDLHVVGYTDCTSVPCRDGLHGDPNGHGTHVAGIAAARDNGIGTVGLAPGARVWSIKVLKADGTGALSSVVAGLDWILARSDTIDVANLSLVCSCDSPTLRAAVTRAAGSGLTIVAAAGNQAVDAARIQPASLPEVLAVSALADFDGMTGGHGSPSCRFDVDDTLADFSNHGTVIDLAAPGVCIRSTWPGAGYRVLSGTSMAAPHVAAAAALLTSSAEFRGRPDLVRSALLAAGTDHWLDESGDGVQEPLLDTSSLIPHMLPAAPVVQLSIGDAWVQEPAAGTTAVARLPVRLSRALPAGLSITVEARTYDGTARAGSGDFSPMAQRVLFPPGEVERVVEVTVHGDNAAEDVEFLRVVLGEAPGATVVDAIGVVQIVDPVGLPALSVDDVTVVEPRAGQAPAIATLRLDRPVAGNQVVTATVTAVGGTARSGEDFSATTSVVTFTAGQTAATVSVPILADLLPELDESLTLKLSSVAGAVLADNVGTVTVLDRDGPLTASVSDAWARESDPHGLQFDIVLSRPPGPGQTVSVTAATAAGSAKAPGDYATVAPRRVEFNAGETVKVVTVPLIDDAVQESDETMSLRLSSPAGVQLADASGTGRIGDDDGRVPLRPPPALSVSDVRVLEPDDGQQVEAAVTLSLDYSSASPVSVDVSTGSAADSAVAGIDFVAVPRTRVTIPAGALEATVPVTVLGNDRRDGHRTFTLQLSTPSQALLADSVGTITVADPAGPLQVAAGNARVQEGQPGDTPQAIVQLTLSHPVASGQAASVQVSARSGSAVIGRDTAPFPTSRVHIPAGASSVDVPVPITGDDEREGLESLSLVLSSPAGLVIADATANVVIIEHEGPLQAAVADVEVEEGHDGTQLATVTVQLDAAPAAGQTVSVPLLGTTDVTASLGADHRGVQPTLLVFSEGISRLTFEIQVIGDLSPESDETYQIRLGTASGGVLTDDRAVIRIHDDD